MKKKQKKNHLEQEKRLKKCLEQEIKIQEITKKITFFFSFQSQMALFLYVGIACWY